ncbi:efflux transporter outer membrane subunit [uncultured Rhodoblastus sp.]|uniref:efflux transporter outer membrane subunit n=1 Tax=uncultured Rhodoblastus sp. TaxID=543037 RepID=UPI0025F84CD2|nr:efflux transporter outer membrane subunit [uncultured Rhodoblastus sp.]
MVGLNGSGRRSGTKRDPIRREGRTAPAATAAFWALLVLALAGCDLDKESLDSGIATPTRFQAVGGGGRVALQRELDDWPARFGSKELTHLVAQAQSQNLDIAAAVARIAEAEAQARVAAATLYPTVAAGGAGGQALIPGVSKAFSPPYRSQRTNAFGLNLNASYEIDFWNKNHDAAASGLLSAQASVFDRDVVALSTTASVVNLYFQLLAAQDRLRVAHQNVALAEHVLRAIVARRAVGTSSALDEAQQTTIVAQQRANVPPLEQIELQDRNLLAVLLGRTPESVSIKGGSLERLTDPAVRAGLPSKLLLRRPDVAEAEDRLAAQGLQVSVARAAFFPDVTLTGQYGILSAVFKNLFTPQAAAYSFAANLAQPIFNGGALQGQLDLQKGKFDELLADYRKTILTSFSDVENGLIAVAKTAEQLRLQTLAVKSAQRAYEDAFLQLQTGTMDIVTLAVIQNTLFQAEDLLVQVRSAHFQATTTLYQALGGGWTRPPEALLAATAGQAAP